MDDHEYEQRILEIQDRVLTMTDEEVRGAYLASDGEAGDPWVDALVQAHKDRDIDY